MQLKPEFCRFLRTQPIQFPLAESRRRVRHALDHDELMVRYQPVFHGRTLEITGFEAFLRAPMPDGSLENPLLVPLDQLDFSLAREVARRYHRCICTDLRAWSEAGLSPKSLAINVTSRELMDPVILADIRGQFIDAGLSPRDLRLQVHGVYLEHPFSTALKDAICQLRDAGSTIVLDNFGLGEISERVLSDAPLDYLKVHRKVTAKHAGRNERSGVLENLFGLAGRYGFRTIAEGIERDDQLEEYRRLNCTEVQGSLLGEMMTRDELSSQWRQGFRQVVPALSPAPVALATA